MTKLIHAAKKFLRAEEAATMTEYGVMIALIAAISVGVVTTLGGQVQTAFQTLVTALTP